MAIVGGTWTYSGSPAASDKDAVRFLIGDTDGNNQLISDQEIDWTLTTEGGIYRAAACLCENLASSASLVDKEVGDLKISGSQQAMQYRARAKALLHRAALSGMTVFAGGVSLANKQTYEDDTDVNQPTFIRGQWDYPGLNQRGNGQSS